MNIGEGPINAVPPAANACTINRNEAGIVISFSPKGVFKTYIGHLVCSIILSLLGLIVLLVPRHTIPQWRLIAVSFLAAGLYLLFSTIHAGLRRTTVAAGQQGLLVENVSRIFSSRKSWSLSQIDGISLFGYRTATVTVGGQQTMLPLDLNRSDMKWLVATVRQALGMPPYRAKRTVLPNGSRIRWQRTDETAKMIVPSKRIPPAFLVILILWFIALLAWRAINPVPGEDMDAIRGLIAFLCACQVAFLLLRNKMPHTTIFEITASTLSVTSPFFLSNRRRQWRPEQLESVTAIRECVCLWRRGNFRRPVQIRLGCSEKDSSWIAQVIQHEMNLLPDETNE